MDVSWTIKKAEHQRIDGFELWRWSPLDCKAIKPVYPKRDQSWIFIGRTDVEAETPILWPPDAKNWLTGVSASASVLPMNIQDWFPLGLIALISLQSKEFSKVFNTTVQKHQFFGAQLSLYSPTPTSIHGYWKNHNLTRWTFVDKVMFLFFNVLSRLVIAFLPRSKCLLI